ncbi:DUF4124 domain-containing protein [Pseudoalteromonas sp. SR44-5]|uniref:DUF4124 domain-containing protein n=1 Tax=unclassified Pseudoalteromonas TaxID=194690 RepID=UPI00160171E6|nr:MULTISPECIES: DUF4124 domain-containing protein [unclassified Pseudoalteromonas]MBB1367949.1 DUF4124 domain-containing protein [Pseudoalteromonas sp. SR44-5]MBB1468701.1 DUF4124 domain-containing protein [Pseudoalteromonas sp. SG41-5]
MKYFAYLAIMVLLISVAALFYLQRPDGQTWLTSDGISSKSNQLTEQMVELSSDTFAIAAKLVSETSQKVVESITDESSVATTVIYKWQDQQGQWHYSDQPNPNGTSEKVILDPRDITVTAAEDTSILKGTSKTTNMSLMPNSSSVYDPAVMKKLFEDAEQVKEQLEHRTKSLDETH